MILHFRYALSFLPVAIHRYFIDSLSTFLLSVFSYKLDSGRSTHILILSVRAEDCNGYQSQESKALVTGY